MFMWWSSLVNFQTSHCFQLSPIPFPIMDLTSDFDLPPDWCTKKKTDVVNDAALQKRIERWYGQKRIEWELALEDENDEPVPLHTRSEFDVIKHQHKLIDFGVGGKVGDEEWHLQYMHNSSVLLERKRRDDPPMIAPMTYIVLDDSDREEDISCFEIIFEGHVLDRVSMELSYIAQRSFDICPLLPPHVDPKRVHFLNVYGQEFVHVNKKGANDAGAAGEQRRVQHTIGW